MFRVAGVQLMAARSHLALSLILLMSSCAIESRGQRRAEAPVVPDAAPGTATMSCSIAGWKLQGDSAVLALVCPSHNAPDRSCYKLKFNSGGPIQLSKLVVKSESQTTVRIISQGFLVAFRKSTNARDPREVWIRSEKLLSFTPLLGTSREWPSYGPVALIVCQGAPE